MPSEKMYFAKPDDAFDGCHLIIHITADGGLYVEVGYNINGCELQNIVLPPSDAIEILEELANDLEYNLIPNTHKSSS